MRLVLIKLSLGDLSGIHKAVVRELGVDDLVTELGEVLWFDATENGVPAVEEADVLYYRLETPESSGCPRFLQVLTILDPNRWPATDLQAYASQRSQKKATS